MTKTETRLVEELIGLTTTLVNNVEKLTTLAEVQAYQIKVLEVQVEVLENRK